MPLSRRYFIRNMGLGLASAGLAAENLACSAGIEAGESEKLLIDRPGQPEPAPKGVDRLSLGWYQDTARRLKRLVAEQGVDAVLLSSDTNMVYFTGCFRGSGERSTWALFPMGKEDAVIWFAPGIDRDLIRSWWCTDFEYYFCYPHAEGGYPDKGQVVRGKRVDLFEWLLAGLKKRGYQGKTIGTDMRLSQEHLHRVEKLLPGTEFVDISGTCLGMRVLKTPEEIALTQRAYRYFDKVHAFARDYILERGTEATDFEIGQALQAFGIKLLMRDIEYDGRPNKGVGIEVTSHYVRAGVSTAYPHPNQFFHNRVKRGQPVYVNTDLKMGGYGGECYRNYQIAPVSAVQEKMWEVVADCVRIQVEETRPGAVCSEIAEKIHLHQVKNGMQNYIYHRPAHGSGQNSEGHQPPFISLGDHTVIEAGMTFSVEPGLYDEANGLGINPSDNLLVTDKGAVLMSRVPYSKEWSFLEL